MTALTPTPEAATPPAHAGVEVARATGLCVSFANRRVLHDISLSITRGQRVALLGPNGSGKTTLLRSLATLLRPARGSLSLFGSTVRPSGASHAARRRIGFVGHQPMLYRDLSVHENLVLFARLYDVEDAPERIRELLHALALHDHVQAPVASLSRGTAQRAAIARALVHRPQLLLADEPLTALDAAAAARVEHCFDDLCRHGGTLVMSSHDIVAALRTCPRAVCLRGGRVVIDAPSASLTPDAVLRAAGGTP